MTIRDQFRRERYRKDEKATGSARQEHQDLTSDDIRTIREQRQVEREQEQLAGPDDGREMFKLAEEAARAEAPVDTDLSPGNPELAGLMADMQGSMVVDQLATGQDGGEMADLVVGSDGSGGRGDLLSFVSGGFD